MIKQGKDLIIGDKIYYAKSCLIITFIEEWTDCWMLVHFQGNHGISYVRSDYSFGVVSQNNLV